MTVYYNEIEPSAILWLQAAMNADIISKGDIDTRSIEDVRPDELIGYDRCHWFSGIGGWEIAIKIAESRGWKQQGTLWTGSCPCQPFSTAGKGAGVNDARHLWPAWFWLIQQCRPSIVFGEQVANAVAKGWLDDVAHDLESEGYAVGAAIIPACSVGAPHKRDRLWFVGNAKHDGQLAAAQSGSERQAIQHNTQGQNSASESEGASAAKHVANPISIRQSGQGQFQQPISAAADSNRQADRFDDYSEIDWYVCPDGKQRPVKSSLCLLVDGIPAKLRKAALHGYGNAIVPEVAAEFILASGLCPKP
jgi:DNA (cytosine-5)-methyltransferase 1